MSEKIQAKREDLKKKSQAVKDQVEAGEFETVNAAIIANYYKDHDNREFKTFKQWRKEGKQVKKGSKAFCVWGRPVESQKDDGEEYDFFPICHLFSNAQVN